MHLGDGTWVLIEFESSAELPNRQKPCLGRSCWGPRQWAGHQTQEELEPSFVKIARTQLALGGAPVQLLLPRGGPTFCRVGGSLLGVLGQGVVGSGGLGLQEVADLRREHKWPHQGL